VQVASGGRTKSPEELLQLYRERQMELRDSLDAVKEGISDIKAGRVYSFDDVNDEIRRKHSWSLQQA
jgi:hypothetical protein